MSISTTSMMQMTRATSCIVLFLAATLVTMAQSPFERGITAATVGSITIATPAPGETIDGGRMNYQISVAGGSLASGQTLEYSLDGGSLWNLVGVVNTGATSFAWEYVPNLATSQALVRVREGKTTVVTSSPFTIDRDANLGSVHSIELNGLDWDENITNGSSLGINWNQTGIIGSKVWVEYSVDGMTTWNRIAAVPITDPQNIAWTTPATGTIYPAYIRIVSDQGFMRTSAPFSIGPATVASAASDEAATGYSISSFPNPAGGSVSINVTLPSASRVTLSLFDELGRNLGTIESEQLGAGSHRIPINSSSLAPGTYTCVVRAGTARLVRRISIVR